MRFQTDKPDRIVLLVPEEHRATFGELNLLCILNNVPLVDKLADLARQEIALPSSRELLRYTWLPWKPFQAEMKKAGYSVSRFAFWEYRNKGMIDDAFVRHDGQSTVYQLEGILGYFKNSRFGKPNGQMSGAPDNRVAV